MVSFLIASFFYSLIGVIVGLFAHLVNGVVQHDIKFNVQYVWLLIKNVSKIIIVFFGASLAISLLISAVPTSFLNMLHTDMTFMHQLIYYLLAFAGFDFTLVHVVRNGHGTK